MNKKLAIILVNWNQYELTKSCIMSIFNCSYQNFKIIVVDNCSKDKSVSKLKKDFPNIHFIQNNSNLGFTGANNKGIEYAKSEGYEYIMLLNNDTEVDENFIEPLLNRLNSEKELGAIQPLILNFHNQETVWNFGGRFNKFFGIPITLNKNIELNTLQNESLTEWISGCCFLFRSSLVDLIGCLDDDYFVYYEDSDYSLKIKNAGYKLGIESKSIIYHHEGESWKKEKYWGGSISPFVHFLVIRNHIFFIKKNKREFNCFGKWIFQIFKLAAYSSYFIFMLRFEKLKMVYKGFFEGLKYKV
jgi:GT2 family glycosyltransferase